MPESLRDIIVQVKEGADIVQVIGQYVPLRKAGARYLGLCPFHADRSPSLNVNPSMGIYKCFACGAGGDVIKFVQEYEKLGFIDALKLVAERVGVRVPDALEEKREGGERDRSAQLLKALESACAFYEAQLARNAEASAYLAGRGVGDEARAAFRLGYAPEDPAELLRMAAQSGLPMEAFVEAGVVGEREPGRRTDRFRGRIVFPIRNLSRKVIGFGARTLRPDGVPKYLNSPESPFYHKSRVLYGLDLARDAMEKSGEAVLVEGYMDQISLWQAGVRNAVAVSGTALTREHVQALARFVRRVHFLLDADAAGQAAMRRSLEPLLEAGVEVRFPAIEGAKDPDEFARARGGEGVRAALAAAGDVVDFLTRPLRSGARLSPEEREALLQEGYGLLRAIPSFQVRQAYLHSLGKKFGLSSPAALPADLRRAPALAAAPAPAATAAPKGPDWQLLGLLLSSGDLCRRALGGLDLEWLDEGPVRETADLLLAFVEDRGGLDVPAFLETLSGERQGWLAAADLRPDADPARLGRQFEDTLRALELRHLRRRLAAEPDPARHMELKKRVFEITSPKKRGANP